MAEDTAVAAAATSATDTRQAGYALVGSYSTVRVLSPTQIIDVVYCTIQTKPSNVIASITVQESVFDSGAAGTELYNFATAIEVVMAFPHVVAAVGDSGLDQSGLQQDSVIFTVEYRDPVRAPYGATAQVAIGAAQLDFTDALIGRAFRAKIETQLGQAYANLKAAAGG